MVQFLIWLGFISIVSSKVWIYNQGPNLIESNCAIFSASAIFRLPDLKFFGGNWNMWFMQRRSNKLFPQLYFRNLFIETIKKILNIIW